MYVQTLLRPCESPFEVPSKSPIVPSSPSKVPSQSPFGGRAHAPRRHRPRHRAASGVAGWRTRPPPPSALARPLRGAELPRHHPNDAFTYNNTLTARLQRGLSNSQIDHVRRLLFAKMLAAARAQCTSAFPNGTTGLQCQSFGAAPPCLTGDGKFFHQPFTGLNRPDVRFRASQSPPYSMIFPRPPT